MSKKLEEIIEKAKKWKTIHSEEMFLGMKFLS